jgi:hypothetical protein
VAVNFISGENHRPVASHWQTLSHNVESSRPRHERDEYFSEIIWYTSFFLYRSFQLHIPSCVRHRSRIPHL